MLSSLSASLLFSLMFAVVGAPAWAANVEAGSSEGTIKGSDLIGMKVGPDGESQLGTVQDAIVDLSNSQVLFYVVSKGKAFSLGDRRIALPAGLLHLTADRTGLEARADAETLKRAPKVDPSKWDGAVPSNDAVAKIYQHYGTGEPGPMHDRSEQDSRSGTASIRRGEKLLGMAVVSATGERIGEIEDFIVALPSGRLVVLVLSSEKYIARDGALIAVPASKFAVREGVEGLLYDAKPDELAKAPHFSVGKWPDFNQEDYMRGVYGAFGVPGIFPGAPRHTSESKAREYDEDTRQNQSSPTALEQGNSDEDLRITREIRKRLVGVDELSVAAQNVQIITSGGRVVLKGEVRNGAEQHFILSQAVRVVGEKSVDDQLTIKPRK